MNVRLLVLGLLALQPMHGYALRKLAIQSRVTVWAGILPGSIYHALDRLAEEGLIAPKAVAKPTGRAREVFAITAKGRRALHELTLEAWSAAPRSFPTSWYGAVLFRNSLQPDEEQAAVQDAVARLSAEIEAWEAARPLKQLGPHQALLYENGLRHLQADLELLRALQRLEG